jgi:hypothetical protein
MPLALKLAHLSFVPDDSMAEAGRFPVAVTNVIVFDAVIPASGTLIVTVFVPSSAPSFRISDPPLVA